MTISTVTVLFVVVMVPSHLVDHLLWEKTPFSEFNSIFCGLLGYSVLVGYNDRGFGETEGTNHIGTLNRRQWLTCPHHIVLFYYCTVYAGQTPNSSRIHTPKGWCQQVHQ